MHNFERATTMQIHWKYIFTNTFSKLGTYNKIDCEILVSLAEFEQFYFYVFHSLTFKKITFFLHADGQRTEFKIY